MGLFLKALVIVIRILKYERRIICCGASGGQIEISKVE